MTETRPAPPGYSARMEAAVAYIHVARESGKKSGLDNMRALCALLGNPQNALRAIHVAGTNGKGSTCACIEAVLRAGGYRTGLYTSPFLQHYTERIRLDGLPIEEAAFLAAFDPVQAAVERLREQGVSPTAFEIGTALALLAFAQADMDLCIIEVGLGGRLDPTNIIAPLVCAITAIGLDHQSILGDTLEKIAAEKAGIIKPGVPVVTAPAAPEVRRVFGARVKEVAAPWYPLTGQEMVPLPTDPSLALTAQRARFVWGGAAQEVVLHLLGAHQLENAATALAVVALLGDLGCGVDDVAVVQGLSGARWPGRLEWFPGALATRGVLLDGAHNGHGLHSLAGFVSTLPPAWPKVLLCGMLEEKIDPEALDTLAALASGCVRAVITAPPDRRALPPDRLAHALTDRGLPAFACPDLAQALETAAEAAGPGGMVIATGSLYLIGALRGLLA